jgi:flagellar motility protein MotE (MotC chaperone)
MDQQKLRTLVFEKTGVKIDVDDPVFALVALNEAVLAEAVERHVALLDEATRELAEQVQALQDGGSVCRYGAGAAERPALLKSAAVPGAGHLSRAERRMIGIGAGAAVLGALLVLFGQATWFKPAAPLVQVRQLSAEQQAAIDKGDKLARIVQKLDPKTRDAILAEMQKP